VHTRGKSQFHAFYFISLLKCLYTHQYSIGYQVRKLVIDNGHLEPAILGQLPLLCPFLEVLIFDGVILSESARREPLQYYQQRRNREELDQVRHHFLKWKQMRQLVELNGITVTHALLQQPSTSLSCISVQFNNQNDRTNCKESLLNSLHHAPRLVSLSIERVYLTVEELEKIHESCPRLSTLKLVDTMLLPIMTANLRVSAATLMRAFYFIKGGFCDDASLWLTYICEKYTFVRTLDMGSSTFFHSSKQEAYGTQLLQIANSLIKLSVLNLQSFSLPNSFFLTLDHNGTFLTEMTLGDKKGSPQVLSQEIAALIESQQKCTIHSLTVHGQDDIRWLHPLIGQCTFLTTLHITMNITDGDNTGATVYIDKILVQCPQLLSLTITNAQLQATASSITAKTTVYALQSLKLDNVLIGSNLFDVIDTCCPHLAVLSLIATVPVLYDTTFRLHLPHHRLHTLVMDRIRVSRKCSIRLGASRYKITTHKSVWYDLVGYECCATGPQSSCDAINRISSMVLPEKMRARKVKVVPDDTDRFLDQSVHVSVVCKSLENLYLTGLQIGL
jgi:hypothetical protein